MNFNKLDSEVYKIEIVSNIELNIIRNALREYTKIDPILRQQTLEMLNTIKYGMLSELEALDYATIALDNVIKRNSQITPSNMINEFRDEMYNLFRNSPPTAVTDKANRIAFEEGIDEINPYIWTPKKGV